MSDKPSVLFVCVHNAGRSQMAAGFLEHFAAGGIEVLSAGSAPKETLNPIAVAAMAEVGIDIANNKPKILTVDAVQASDVVITMGCGDTCPYFPGKRYEDWVLDDPAGQSIEKVREIRDEIKARVANLVSELLAK
ncbi:MAG: arsenate reductase ArsC [Actinobacteria bacterium]|jgi:arsenate reductase (thioredoxin)|uniref:Arsenate reductase ArsC n=1 Tax=Candidatus Fonsibacter lacus TaxID=2576439 RepID=A0A965GDS4_9PROT|nr:arsenate reductase ArsC [Candidatus Fonsibacter lacus]